jgi:hypothetical protein
MVDSPLRRPIRFANRPFTVAGMSRRDNQFPGICRELRRPARGLEIGVVLIYKVAAASVPINLLLTPSWGWPAAA